MVITCGIYLYSTKVGGVLIGHVTNYNSWSIPKGQLDKIDNGYFDCAVRELWEETNILITDVKILGKYELDFVVYKNNKKKLKSFLIVTDTPISELDIKCNSYFYDNNVRTPEFDDFKWVKINELGDYTHYTQSQNIKQIENLIFK